MSLSSEGTFGKVRLYLLKLILVLILKIVVLIEVIMCSGTQSYYICFHDLLNIHGIFHTLNFFENLLLCNFKKIPYPENIKCSVASKV